MRCAAAPSAAQPSLFRRLTALPRMSKAEKSALPGPAHPAMQLSSVLRPSKDEQA